MQVVNNSLSINGQHVEAIAKHVHVRKVILIGSGVLRLSDRETQIKYSGLNSPKLCLQRLISHKNILSKLET